MKRFGMGVGGVSLILVFSVLCLAVLTLLTFSSANRDKALTDKLKQSVESYYAADSAAVRIAAKLQAAVRRGEIPSEIDQTEIYSEGNGVYTYSCPIDARRAIAVRLQISDGAFDIISWRESDIADWTPQDQLDIFGGE